jgi:tetratricopeptide (TPR) repeat protein
MKNTINKNILSIAVVAVLGLLIVGRYYAVNKAQRPLPKLKPRGGEAMPSSEFLNVEKAVEYYETEIRRKPKAVKNYVDLANVFLQESRVTGNHHEYIPKAQERLDEALRLEPENFEAVVAQASILLTRHQFLEAKRLAQIAIAKNSYSAFAYGVLVDAHAELGEYDEAVKASDKMLGRRPDLRSYARASYLRELHGDNAGAIEAMRMAVDAGVPGHENRAWVLYHLGLLYLQTGKLDTAAFIFKGTLEERPNYAYALSGLAQVNAAKKNYEEALRLLKYAHEVTPEHVFLEQLADTYRCSGDARRADSTAQEVLKMFGQHEKGGWNINREFAMFCANHNMNLPAALKRAKLEYEARPHNLDVQETYAWLLYKNGQARDAIPLIEQAMRLKTRRAALPYHAGMIYFAANQFDKARIYLNHAIAENLSIHPLDFAEAQKTLAQLAAPNYALKAN